MTVVVLIVIGVTAGALAASLGIGGGIVFVPALVVVVGLSQQVAQGTSLAVIVPTVLLGTIVHARAGRVDWRLAVPIGLAGIGGGLLGARIALDLDPDLLRRVFAVFLLLVAVRMLRRTKRAT